MSNILKNINNNTQGIIYVVCGSTNTKIMVGKLLDIRPEIQISSLNIVMVSSELNGNVMLEHINEIYPNVTLHSTEELNGCRRLNINSNDKQSPNISLFEFRDTNVESQHVYDIITDIKIKIDMVIIDIPYNEYMDTYILNKIIRELDTIVLVPHK